VADDADLEGMESSIDTVPARSGLDEVTWTSLLTCIYGLPRIWKRDEPALRRFIKGVLWVLRTGAPWRDLPASFGHWASVYHRWRRWCLRGWWEAVFERLRPCIPAAGLVIADSTTCKAHRSAAGAARSSAEAEGLGRSRGGLTSKLHVCVDGTGRVLRLIVSPGQHADLRYARALLANLPARDAVFDRGYLSTALRHDLAAQGCTVHTPPKRGMVDPPPWDAQLYAKRHLIENAFCSLKDNARLALRRDKTRHSFSSFAYLAATLFNLRLENFSHRP
jgi:transposase